MTIRAVKPRMPGETPRRIYEATPHDQARAICADEVRRRRAGLPPLLDHTSWRLTGTCLAISRSSPGLPTRTGEWDVALGYLAQRGLVEEHVPEAQVTFARPQLYRWARCATAEQLGLFAAREVAQSSAACAAPGCRNARPEDSIYCSARCATRAQAAKRGKR